jgi:hypothetical protein
VIKNNGAFTRCRPESRKQNWPIGINGFGPLVNIADGQSIWSEGCGLRLFAGHQCGDTPHDETKHQEKAESSQHGGNGTNYGGAKFGERHVVSLPSRNFIFEVVRKIFKDFFKKFPNFCQDRTGDRSRTPTARGVLTTKGPP